MKTKIKVFLFVSLLYWGNTLFSEDYVVITHSSNAIDSLSVDQLRAIMLGDVNRWQGGGAVRLAVLKWGEFHGATIRAITGRRASQFSRAWKKLIFTGQGIAPREQGSVEEMLEYVAANEGSLGYVPVGQEGDAKVITID